MAETQTLSPEILNVTENVTFTPLELKYFVLELKDMMAEGKFDLPKVIRAARFYADIERSDQQLKEGKVITFTDDEWEKFINEQSALNITSTGVIKTSKRSTKSIVCSKALNATAF